MAETNDAAKKAAEEKQKADAEAKKKQDAEAKKKADAEAKKDAEAKPKQVRVILKNGTLGHLLLTEGKTTDDPAYVALLGTKRGKRLVEEVK